MDSAASVVRADEVWARLGGVSGAGAGVKIGIIDTGIQHLHPMFHDPALTPPPGYPRPEANAAYTNNKVIVARNYVKPEYGYVEQDVDSPEDEEGHGSGSSGGGRGRQRRAPSGYP